MKLLTRNPLAYPAHSTPGFDQDHVAGKSVVQSSIPSGNTFINLLNGKPGTVAGVPVPVMTAAGPGVSYPATVAQTGIAGPMLVTSGVTMSVILIPTSGSVANMIRTASAGNIMALSTTTAFVPSVFNNASSAVFTGIIPPLTLGVPYFYAASVNTAAAGNSPTYAVVTNLLTGQTWSGTLSVAARPITTTNGVSLIGQGGNQVLAAMFSATALQLPELQAWAQDPWSFWFPRANDNFLGIPRVPRASGVTVAVTGVSAITIAGVVGKLETLAPSGAAVTAAAGALGTLTAVSPSGAAATTSAGALAKAISLALIGASASASAGTVSVQTGSSVTVAIAGAAISTSAGQVTVSATLAIAGAAVSASAGSLTKTISVLIAGAVITAAAGAVGFSIPVSVAISGAGVAVTAGQVSIARTAYVDNIPPGMTLSLRRKRPLRNP